MTSKPPDPKSVSPFDRPLQPIRRNVPKNEDRRAAIETVCPNCGAAVNSVKCKVVCRKCGTLVMNCSEF